jgi:hypothetical protein
MRNHHNVWCGSVLLQLNGYLATSLSHFYLGKWLAVTRAPLYSFLNYHAAHGEKDVFTES